jgi:hypothetical protein
VKVKRQLLQKCTVLACALAIAFSNARAQSKPQSDAKDEAASLRATVESLRAEVALLRKSVMRLQLDLHRENIQKLKAQIDTARAEQSRLAELDRARQQDLRDIEALLTQGETAADERLDMESARAELAVVREREIAEQSDAVRLRESELLRRLETEEQAAKRIDEAWKLTKGKTE